MTCKNIDKYHKLKILHKEGKWIKVVPKGLIIVKLVVGSSNPNLTPLSFFVIEDNEPPLWLGVRGLSLELPKLNKKILYKKRKGFPHLACWWERDVKQAFVAKVLVN